MGISDFLGLSVLDETKRGNLAAKEEGEQGYEDAQAHYDQGLKQANQFDTRAANQFQGLTSAGQPATDLYNQLIGGGDEANQAFQNSQDYQNMLHSNAASAEDLARYAAGNGTLQNNGSFAIDLADNQFKHRTEALQNLYGHLAPGMEMFSQGKSGKAGVLGGMADRNMDWARLSGLADIGKGDVGANFNLANNAAYANEANQDAGLWGGILGGITSLGGKAIGKWG